MEFIAPVSAREASAAAWFGTVEQVVAETEGNIMASGQQQSPLWLPTPGRRNGPVGVSLCVRAGEWHPTAPHNTPSSTTQRMQRKTNSFKYSLLYT